MAITLEVENSSPNRNLALARYLKMTDKQATAEVLLKLDEVKSDVKEVRTEVRQVKTDVSSVREDIVQLKTRFEHHVGVEERADDHFWSRDWKTLIGAIEKINDRLTEVEKLNTILVERKTILADHESRIRIVETSGIKMSVKLAMIVGGSVLLASAIVGLLFKYLEP